MGGLFGGGGGANTVDTIVQAATGNVDDLPEIMGGLDTLGSDAQDIFNLGENEFGLTNALNNYANTQATLAGEESGLVGTETGYAGDVAGLAPSLTSMAGTEQGYAGTEAGYGAPTLATGYNEYQAGATGQLTPSMAALASQALKEANIGTTGTYSNLGLGDSTMEGQDLASNQVQNLAEQGNLESLEQQLGLSGITAGQAGITGAGNLTTQAGNLVQGAATDYSTAGGLVGNAGQLLQGAGTLTTGAQNATTAEGNVITATGNIESAGASLTQSQINDILAALGANSGGTSSTQQNPLASGVSSLGNALGGVTGTAIGNLLGNSGGLTGTLTSLADDPSMAAGIDAASGLDTTLAGLTDADLVSAGIGTDAAAAGGSALDALGFLGF